MGLFGGNDCGNNDGGWIWILIIIVLVLCLTDGSLLGGSNSNCCDNCCDNNCCC